MMGVDFLFSGPGCGADKMDLIALLQARLLEKAAFCFQGVFRPAPGTDGSFVQWPHAMDFYHLQIPVDKGDIKGNIGMLHIKVPMLLFRIHKQHARDFSQVLSEHQSILSLQRSIRQFEYICLFIYDNLNCSHIIGNSWEAEGQYPEQYAADREREVFFQFHAAGGITCKFAWRKGPAGPWKSMQDRQLIRPCPYFCVIFSKIRVAFSAASSELSAAFSELSAAFSALSAEASASDAASSATST